MSNGDAPPESSALREARAQLDWLADHDLDVHPRGPGGIDLIRDRPDVVAWLCRLREMPLSMWTWAELLAWGGLRRQRLREVLWQRGLPPEPPGLLSLERRLEADVLVLASHDSAAFHHRIPNTIVDTRLAALLAFGANRTPASRPVLAAACEELVPRGFFALEAWCAGVFDGKDPEQVRADWRARWLDVDAALGADGLARLASRPPRVTLDDDDAGTPRAWIEVTFALDADNLWHASPSSSQRTFAQPAITIGRSAENDIAVVGAGLSRRHATLRIEDRAVFITDHDTTNGIIIDGRPIRGEAILAKGHVATLGGWQLGVRLPGPWH